MSIDLDTHVAVLEFINDKVWFEDQYNKANALLAIWECIGSFERIKTRSSNTFKENLRQQASIASGYVRMAVYLFDDDELKALAIELNAELEKAWFYAFYKHGGLRTVCTKIRRRALTLWIEYIQRKPSFEKVLREDIEFINNSTLYTGRLDITL